MKLVVLTVIQTHNSNQFLSKTKYSSSVPCIIIIHGHKNKHCFHTKQSIKCQVKHVLVKEGQGNHNTM